jgi:hypothetical protein
MDVSIRLRSAATGRRTAAGNGDVLRLSTKPMIFQGVERRAELVWERVGHD